MFPLTLRDLPDVLKAEAPRGLGFAHGEHPETALTGAAIDSRAVRPGHLFFALPGERTDGHAHAADAVNRGAAAVVFARDTGDRPAVIVPDPAAALARLAGWNRERFTGPLIAVGGSHGKTTCRELIAAALNPLGPGVRSRANYNNALGVPLTLCELNSSHRFAVVEVGASRPGELTALCELARPTVAVLTGIGNAHVGTFGGPAALRAAKAELFSSPPQADGSAVARVVNGDDDCARTLARSRPGRTILAGTTAGCDVRIEPLPSPPDRSRFRRGRTTFDLATPARHLLPLAACAIAVGEELGLSDERIAAGLARFRPPPGRCAVTVAGGVTVIDDTYNAPPEGFTAAVDLLAGWAVEPPGRRWLVAGGMAELGDESDRLHRSVGRRIAAARFDRAVFVGDTGARLAAAGPVPHAVLCEDAAEACDRLLSELRPGDVLLVKGCRADRLERVVAAVLGRFRAA